MDVSLLSYTRFSIEASDPLPMGPKPRHQFENVVASRHDYVRSWRELVLGVPEALVCCPLPCCWRVSEANKRADGAARATKSKN